LERSAHLDRPVGLTALSPVQDWESTPPFAWTTSMHTRSRRQVCGMLSIEAARSGTLVHNSGGLEPEDS